LRRSAYRALPPISGGVAQAVPSRVSAIGFGRRRQRERWSRSADRRFCPLISRRCCSIALPGALRTRRRSPSSIRRPHLPWWARRHAHSLYDLRQMLDTLGLNTKTSKDM